MPPTPFRHITVGLLPTCVALQVSCCSYMRELPSISSIYLAYLEIVLLNHLFLIILKIRNHLLFAMNIINLLEVQYSISISWLLLLILILRLQIHEIVKIQNSVMNLQDILLQEI